MQPQGKAVWSYLKKLKMELSCDPATPLLEIYPKKPLNGNGMNICTPMLIAALFTIAQLWKQPKYPSECPMDKKVVVLRDNEILLNRKK